MTLRSARNLALALLLSTLGWGSLATADILSTKVTNNSGSTHETTVIATNAVQPEPAAFSVTVSAHDLSLFGVLVLGIMGLLWVRRHTAEL